MSNKYIITNCPAYCYLGKECHNEESRYGVSCCEVTGCVMKQIVELCKEVNTKFYDSVHQRYLSPSKAKFARQILELLDIQEVE